MTFKVGPMTLSINGQEIGEMTDLAIGPNTFIMPVEQFEMIRGEIGLKGVRRYARMLEYDLHPEPRNRHERRRLAAAQRRRS